MEKKQSIQYLTVNVSQQERRVDNFLGLYLKGVPKSRIYQMLRKGEVRVNGKRIKPQFRLELGDQVRIPPVTLKDSSQYKRSPSKQFIEKLEKSIFYEDDNLLVLNKPAGITVHAGSNAPIGVIEALKFSRGKEHYLELAHRLDRDTSGCLLLAKEPMVLKDIQQSLRAEDTEKYYLALLKGQLSQSEVWVEQPLRKNTLKSGERMVKINSDGKAAMSKFSIQKRFKEATLAEVKIMTGRTHQIRVHAQYLGNPLAMDKKYGDKEFNQWIKRKGLNRIFLHAERIAIKLKSYPESILFRASLPDELSQFVDTMETY